MDVELISLRKQATAILTQLQTLKENDVCFWQKYSLGDRQMVIPR